MSLLRLMFLYGLALMTVRVGERSVSELGDLIRDRSDVHSVTFLYLLNTE